MSEIGGGVPLQFGGALLLLNSPILDRAHPRHTSILASACGGLRAAASHLSGSLAILRSPTAR